MSDQPPTDPLTVLALWRRHFDTLDQLVYGCCETGGSSKASSERSLSPAGLPAPEFVYRAGDLLQCLPDAVVELADEYLRPVCVERAALLEHSAILLAEGAPGLLAPVAEALLERADRSIVSA